MANNRQSLIAWLLGLLGFFGSFYAMNYQVGDFKLSFVWSYTFPLIASLAYGPRAALLAGIIGLGAFFPIVLWASNGYASVLTSMLLLAWFSLLGFANKLFEKKNKWWLHPLIFHALFAVFYGLMTYLLFPIAFSLNPTPWNPQAFTEIPQQVIISIISKGTPFMFLSAVTSVLFLKLPPLRKFMQIPVRPYQERNTGIFLISVLGIILFWFCFKLLVNVLLYNNIPIEHYIMPSEPLDALVLLVLVFFGFATALVLCYFSEKQLQSTEWLRESEQTMNLVLGNVEAAVFIKDLQGKYTYVNRKVADIFGLQEQEIIGKSDDYFFDKKSVEEIRISDLPVLLEGTQVYRKETGLAVSGQPAKTYWTVKVPVYDSNGVIQGLCGISTDISKQEIYEKEREHLLVELNKKNEELTRFAYSASHDLRSPLVNIRGYIGELRYDLQVGDKIQIEKDLEIIDRSAQKMGDLITDMLNIIRLGKRDLVLENISIQNIINDVLLILSSELLKVHCKPMVNEPMMVVYGDRNRIYQVVQNIVENAIKYYTPNTPLNLEFSTKLNEGMVECSIKDNGIGIDSRYLSKVFGLFQKINPDSEGTGMGLALLKIHVEQMGGKIWVESEGLGKGSAFKFTLPLGRL